MSFKRDGDDYGGLGILKKRRVAELFANDIPDSEALLCSNGRFACTVCKHKPVFDTINMLAVHRKGKKHLANAAMATAEQQELAELVLKRKHDMYMDGNSSDLCVAGSTSYDGILTSPVYDPRMRRPKVKPYDRKPCLDLSSVQQSSQMEEQHSVPLHQTTHPRFTNFKKDFLRQQWKDNHDRQVDRQTEKQVELASSQSSNNRNLQTGSSERPVPTADSNETTAISPASSVKPESIQTVPTQPTYVHQKYYKKKHYICDRVGKTNITKEEREKKEQLLQLRGAGWKKDWCGKWVKEEGVEFDSDEEPPDVS